MRAVSASAVRAIISRETDKVFVALLLIEHPSIAPVRICSDTAQIVRSDGTYLPFPFEFVLPEDTEGEIPRAAVKLDNVNREIVKQLSTIEGKPTVTFMLVLADTPEVVEYGPAEFLMADAAWNVLTITGTLAYQEDIWMQQVPGQSYTPSNSPGLFR